MPKAKTMELDRDELIDGTEPGASLPQEPIHAWQLRKADARLGRNSIGFSGDISLEVHRDALDAVAGVNDALLPELLDEIRQTTEYKNFAQIDLLFKERTSEVDEVKQEIDDTQKAIAAIQTRLSEPGAMDEMRKLVDSQSKADEILGRLTKERVVVEKARQSAREELSDACIPIAETFKARIASERRERVIAAKDQLIEKIAPVLDELFHATRSNQQLAGWTVDADSLLEKLEGAQP